MPPTEEGAHNWALALTLDWESTSNLLVHETSVNQLSHAGQATQSYILKRGVICFFARSKTIKDIIT